MDNDNAPMGGPLSEAERIAEIRTRLDGCGRGPHGQIAQSMQMFMHAPADIEFLLGLVGVLEGQLATAEDRVRIEQGEVIKRDKAVKSLERALDEQRWYGEQLQSSIDDCSGNHLPIEEYDGGGSE